MSRRLAALAAGSDVTARTDVDPASRGRAARATSRTGGIGAVWRCLTGRDVPTPAAPAVLGEVAGSLRVGASPALAWQRVGVAPGPDGVPTVTAVAEVTGLAPAHARAVVAACRLAADLGAPPVTLLEQVTLAVARDAEAQDRRRAALAGPRATARLLGWLPLGGLGVGIALGADPVGLLLRPAGAVLLAAGGAFALVGHRWIRREVRAAERAGEDSG